MENLQIYLVGGAVRDQLLGLPVKDRDWVVVGATPEAMLDAGFKPVGKDFPVFLHPQTGEEYALARTERKVGQGYHGFACHFSPDVTLEDDLARRDLTINAMAMTPDGKLVDPFGGQADLNAKILRHVSPAFAEDPLRVLRVARFAARYAPLGFSVAPATMQLMRDLAASGELDHLTPERVWQETAKALAEARPSVFFQTLRACGALAALFPEIDRLFGVPQPEKWHPEIDCGIHTMMVLDAAARLTDDVEVRFAALCHDLGKGTTPAEILPHHYGHEERSHALVQGLCTRLRVPNRFVELAELVAKWHGHIHKARELRPSTMLKVLEAVDAFRRPQRFAQLLLACVADARGRTGFEDCAYPQADWWREALQAAQQVDVQPILAAGYQGGAVRDRLHQQRVRAIGVALRYLDIVAE